MDLLQPFRKVRESMSKLVKGIQDDKAVQLKKNADQIKLKQWKDKLQVALAEHASFRADTVKWHDQYLGTHNVLPLAGEGQTKDARQVVRLTYQLIESQIQVNVPQPRVDAIEQEDEATKKMVQGTLQYIGSSNDLKKIVAENERIVKKNTMGYIKLIYNPTAKGHKYIGRLEFANPHPKNVIPQPGMYKPEDMDYMFEINNRTTNQICRKYGEQFRSQLVDQGEGEYKFLDQFTNEENASNDNNIHSVVECWYKDEDGDIGKLTWTEDIILDDMPKFYYKHDPETKEIMYTEKVMMDTPQVDEMGQPVVDETGKPVMVQQEIEVESKVPDQFPYILWYNVRQEKSYEGISDCDVISDQQETIKKLLTIEEEKQIKGTTKIFCSPEIKDKITDATSQIIECDDPNSQVKAVDLKTPDAGLKDLYAILTQAAKDSLGVTDASQGKLDTANLSGEAIKSLAQNSQGRQAPKLFEKDIAFTDFYKLVYQFLVAFFDDKIPYTVDGPNNQKIYGYFDKSKLLKQDSAGVYYYPEFDIFIQEDTGLSKDINFILNSSLQLIQAGAMDVIEFWTIMSSINFPNAETILEMEKEKLAQQQAMLQQQQQMQNEQQMQTDSKTAAKDIIKGMTPEDKQAFETADQPTKEKIIAGLLKQRVNQLPQNQQQ
jgi:hypothetical protein